MNEQKVLVVFDINGTLLKKIKENTSIESHLIRNKRCLRPFAPRLAEFLNSSNLDYGFWTTQKGEKADKSHNALISCGFNNPKFFWKGDMCNRRKIKDLEIVSKHFQEYKPENIIIVDDTNRKIIHKERFIKVSTFRIDNLDSDTELLKLENYLKSMIESMNSNKRSNCVDYLNENKYLENEDSNNCF